MSSLLASSPSLDGISACIARFYCGETKSLELEPDKPNSWLVVSSNGNPCAGVRVFKRGKRYRFEMVA